MNYKQFSLEELYSLESDYILRHWANGGRSEFDMSINSISRAIIEKYNERHGNCFLGAINQHKFLEKGETATLIKYSGQKVFNFEFDIVVPCFDKKLIDLLTEHNTPQDSFDSQKTFRLIEAITSKIQEIGGHQLFWA